MAPYECSVPGCDYVTPEAKAPQMLDLLTLHTKAVHLVHQPAAPAAAGPRPVFSLNMTLAELVNYIAAEEISCSESLSVHPESNTVGHVRQRKSSYERVSK